METKEKKTWRKIITLISIISFLLLTICFTKFIDKGLQVFLLNVFNIRANEDDLLIHYIDVGQGDAIVIQFPNKEIMLIDSGTKYSQNYLVQYIKSTVLKDNKDLVIDYFILTHSDTDHSGGACAIFKEFEVKNFYRPNIASIDENIDDFYIQVDSEEYNEAIKYASVEDKINIEIIKDGYNFYLGDVFVRFFGPLHSYTTTNQISPIIKIQYKDKSFLFTGDVSSEAEKDLVQKYGNELSADVLKVGHHGSENATSIEFLNCVNPSVAIISVGQNSYGHPSMYTIRNLELFGAEIHRTDEEENILFVYGENCFRVLGEVYHSYTYINWWIIALILIAILIVFLIKNIVYIVKTKQIKEKL